MGHAVGQAHASQAAGIVDTKTLGKPFAFFGKDNEDWSDWNHAPGGSDSGSSWRKSYSQRGGYLSVAQNAQGWR